MMAGLAVAPSAMGGSDMVIKLRRLLDNVKSIASKTGRKDGVVDAEDVKITEVTTTEDVANYMAGEMANAREQLSQLSEAMYGAEGNSDARVKETLDQFLRSQGGMAAAPVKPAPTPPKPSGPPVSPGKLVPDLLTIEPQVEAKPIESADGPVVNPEPAEPPKIELKISTMKVGAEAEAVDTQTAAAHEELHATLADGGAKSKAQAAGDIMADVFGHEDEEANPLAALTKSMPDVTATDLIDEAKGLIAMLAEFQPEQTEAAKEADSRPPKGKAATGVNPRQIRGNPA